MDVESKLALIRQLRQEQSYNYQQMDSRAQILYGKNYGDHTQDELPVSNYFSSFKLRLLLAVFMFMLFFYMDTRNISIGEWNCDTIEGYISEDISLSDFSIEDFSSENLSF